MMNEYFSSQFLGSDIHCLKEVNISNGFTKFTSNILNTTKNNDKITGFCSQSSNINCPCNDFDFQFKRLANDKNNFDLKLSSCESKFNENSNEQKMNNNLEKPDNQYLYSKHENKIDYSYVRPKSNKSKCLAGGHYF